MTAVVDPNGTPAPVYTRSGTTIQTIAASGNTLMSATPIVAPSGHSVVIVTTVDNEFTDDDQAVALPDDAQIGDVVEVYQYGQASVIVFTPTGESIGTPGGGTTSSNTLDSGGHAAIFRKVSATIWRYIESA